MNKSLQLCIPLVMLYSGALNATVWTTEIQGGQIRFDDWGYAGPNGRTAMDFSAVNGFGGAAEGNSLDPTGGIGQIQHVITKDPDGLTPDPSYSFRQEFTNAPLYPDANTDAAVNFYNWGYTTTGGSTFNNMRIDYDGDYLIERDDMAFNMYDTIMYNNEALNPTTSDSTYSPTTNATTINFQPYALSDATGWCGSVTASNPAALEGMAGQIEFDFGFEVFFGWSPKDVNGNFAPGSGSMQIVSDFQMRSYGSIILEVSQADGGTADVRYEASAVVNNTNPLTSNINPETGLKEVGGGNSVDENWYNQVSFMGAGILAPGVWVLVDENSGVTTKATGDLAISNDQILRVVDGVESTMPTEEIPEGTQWMYHSNFFSNYTFLMRADGSRIVDAVDMSVYDDISGIPASAFNEDGQLVNLEGAVIQDLSAVSEVPIPAAVWLFGSGLLGLVALARRRSLQ